MALEILLMERTGKVTVELGKGIKMEHFKNVNYKKRITFALIGIFFILNFVAKKQKEEENIDENNPYLVESSIYSSYEKFVKPAIDKILSFIGLLLLFPLYMCISVAIYLEDRGPIFFTQTRVGKDNHFFILHKFRSMKKSAPHDIPTHMLENPEQYITKIGRILRKTSLDELPQIWDIFRGKMSIIGPRPALYNQEDLVNEREKYGADRIMPGLTGLAQIKGRDELEIFDKAKLDGEYTRILHMGGIFALLQDIKCFIGTIGSVLKHEGIVEGGTGKYSSTSTVNSLNVTSDLNTSVDDYGFKKTFSIDRTKKKKILITGADSYVGKSFIAYAEKNYPTLKIDTVDMMDGSWKTFDFSSYDTIFHVAGIAHADVSCVSDEEKKQYYAINGDLAIETARKAKNSKVSQFIFMSSIIIYGNSMPLERYKMIDEDTIPFPDSFYGESKWKGDVGVRNLADEQFKVAVLRCPMIYGRGSKGNYQTLSKMVKFLPIFPDIQNKRSMIHIDNFCEFLCLLILSGEGGIYFPQNSTYTKTSDMVKQIAKVKRKKIYVSKMFNPIVLIGKHTSEKNSKLVDKAFGDLVYVQRISNYSGLDYRVVNFEESIRRTEETYE